MNYQKGGYDAEKIRKTNKMKNEKKYIFMRSIMNGKQKRNIYMKDSKEYIKYNGKFMQIKKYNEMMKKKEELQKPKQSLCKKNCKEENKICNTNTGRCNKVKVNKTTLIAKASKKHIEHFNDDDLYNTLLPFFIKNGKILWPEIRNIDDIKEIKENIKFFWDEPYSDVNGLIKKDYYAIIKEIKKPLKKITYDDIIKGYIKKAKK